MPPCDLTSDVYSGGQDATCAQSLGTVTLPPMTTPASVHFAADYDDGSAGVCMSAAAAEDAAQAPPRGGRNTGTDPVSMQTANANALLQPETPSTTWWPCCGCDGQDSPKAREPRIRPEGHRRSSTAGTLNTPIPSAGERAPRSSMMADVKLREDVRRSESICAPLKGWPRRGTTPPG